MTKISVKTFCTELIEALDALPVKVLIRDNYEHNCEFCALGSWGRFRGFDIAELSFEHISYITGLDITFVGNLAKENDGFEGTYEERWAYMRNYAQQMLDKQVA